VNVCRFADLVVVVYGISMVLICSWKA